MKKKLIVFDLDGTLLDTLADLHASVNHALRKHSLPQRGIDEVRGFVGNGMGLLISRSVPENTPADIEASVLDAFKAHYLLHSADRTVPYAGIEELLRGLRSAGCRLGVVSNKGDAAAKSVIARYFPGVFDCVVGEREGVRRKPAPDSVLETMRSLDCSVSDAVYVGDSEVDILTAKNVGCDCISVSWGFKSREFLEANGAEVIVSSAAELGDLLGL